jgi:hypothetical protein
MANPGPAPSQFGVSGSNIYTIAHLYSGVVMREMTSLKVSKETREALKALGRKGESYDAIIRRLLKEHQKGEPP